MRIYYYTIGLVARGKGVVCTLELFYSVEITAIISCLISCQYSKANSHDKEVQKLYEEMEQQIKAEKERIHNEVSMS